MHVARVDGLLEEWAGGPGGDGYVAPVAGVQDGQRVGDHVVQAGVATDAGDGPQVEVGVQGGEQQRARVVDPGVDVEHDRRTDGGHGWSFLHETATTDAKLHVGSGGFTRALVKLRASWCR